MLRSSTFWCFALLLACVMIENATAMSMHKRQTSSQRQCVCFKPNKDPEKRKFYPCGCSGKEQLNEYMICEHQALPLYEQRCIDGTNKCCLLAPAPRCLCRCTHKNIDLPITCEWPANSRLPRSFCADDECETVEVADWRANLELN